MPAIDVRHPALPELFDPDRPERPDALRDPGGSPAGTGRRRRSGATRRVAGRPGRRRHRVHQPDDVAGATFDAALTDLRRDAMVGLVWPTDDRTAGDAGSPGQGRWSRLGFDPIDGLERGVRSASGRAAGRGRGPADGRGARSRAASGASSSRALTAASMASSRTALGLCLMRDDEILAEAYAPFIGHGVAEVGVVTARGPSRAGAGGDRDRLAGRDRSPSAASRCTGAATRPTRRRSASPTSSGSGRRQPFEILLYRPLEA